MAPPPILRWSDEADQAAQFALTSDEVLIGRNPEADIVLTDRSVSRNHAKIVRRGGNYVLVDLNSSNGTYVEECQIKEHPLRDGDKIRFGTDGVELRFQAPAQTPDPGVTVQNIQVHEAISRALHEDSSPDTPGSELEKLGHILDFHCYFEKTFSPEKTFRQILNSALQISGAERGFILSKHEEDFQYALGLDGAGEVLPQSDFSMSQSIVLRVAEEGRPVFMTQRISDEFAQRRSIVEMKLRAVACLPLEAISPESSQPEILGILYLDSTHSMHALTGLDQKILNKLAEEAGAVLEKLEMIKGIDERKTMEAEMALAEETQRSLLPKTLPDLKGFRIRAFSQPTRNVGGDFYDCFPLSSGEWVGVLGDVSGKGISAALLASLLQGALSTAFESTTEPGEVLNHANRLVQSKSEVHRFVTLFLFVMDSEGSGRFACAGHNPTYVFRAATGEVEEVHSKGLILGIFESASYQSHPLRLDRGDVLLAYSDGLTEARNPEDEEFGEERLLEIIRAQAPAGLESLETAILDSVRGFTQGEAQTDDITFVLVQRCD